MRRSPPLRSRGHVSAGRQPRGRRLRRRANGRGRLLRARLPRDRAGGHVAKHVSRRGRSPRPRASRYGGLAVATPGTVRGLEALHRKIRQAALGPARRARDRARAGRVSRPARPRAELAEHASGGSCHAIPSRAPLLSAGSARRGGNASRATGSRRDARGDRRAGSGRIPPRRGRARIARVRPRDRRRPDGGGSRRLRAVWRIPFVVRLRPLAARHDAASLVGRLPPRVDPRAASIRAAGDISSRDAAETIHLVAEAERRAYADRNRFLGDPDCVDVPLARLLAPARLAALGFSIDPARATPSRDDRGRRVARRARSDDAPLGRDGGRRRRGADVHAERHVRKRHDRARASASSSTTRWTTSRRCRGAANLFGLVQGEANAVRAGARPALVDDADDRPRGRPAALRPRLAGRADDSDDGPAGLPERRPARAAARRGRRRAALPPPAPARTASRSRRGAFPDDVSAALAREGTRPRADRRTRAAARRVHAIAFEKDGTLTGVADPRRLRGRGRTVAESADRRPPDWRRAAPDGIVRAPRGVAQPGSAHGSGPWGRRFESSRPDHLLRLGPASRAGPFSFRRVRGPKIDGAMSRKDVAGTRGSAARRRTPSPHVATKRKVKRARILESAVRSFAAKGFYGTSMDDIAEELLLTRGSLYYYFRDKEEILALCHETAPRGDARRGRARAGLRAAARSGAPPDRRGARPRHGGQVPRDGARAPVRRARRAAARRRRRRPRRVRARASAT